MCVQSDINILESQIWQETISVHVALVLSVIVQYMAQCKYEVALHICVSLLHQVDKESMYVHIALVKCGEVKCTGGTTWRAFMCIQTYHICAQYQIECFKGTTWAVCV